MIEVISATYGKVDVKDKIIKNFIHDDKILFSVSNDIFGDTMPGGIKTLEIEFNDNGNLIKLNAIEGEIFEYPIDNETKERKNFLRTLNRENLINYLNLNGLGIEIGVQNGDYSRYILGNSDLHLILLDSWRHLDHGYEGDGANMNTGSHIDYLNNTLNKLIPKYEGRFTLIRELSEKAALLFKDELFDFIYLDANHRKEAVAIDLKCWWDKLKSGGIMAGHDYVDRDNGVFGVKSAVDEFFKNKDINVEICDFGCCPTWFVKK